METTHIILPVNKSELAQLVTTAVSTALIQCGMKKAPPVDNDLITLKEAAAFLSLSKGTLYQKTHYKTIPYMKRGKKVYFSKKELLQWLQQGNTTDTKRQAETKSPDANKTPVLKFQNSKP